MPHEEKESSGGSTWKKRRESKHEDHDFLGTLRASPERRRRKIFKVAQVKVGDRFGRWKVVELCESSRMCVCVCRCGLHGRVSCSNLRRGLSLSCGCLANEMRLERGRAASRTPEYMIWQQMKDRCFNPRNPYYSDYGGRGITVCERWRLSFRDFISDVGRRPNATLSLDRYPNNDGNYEPGNVRWATKAEQPSNTRRTPLFEIDGIALTVSGWADAKGINRVTVHNRLRKGFTLLRALTTPVKQYKRRNVR